VTTTAAPTSPVVARLRAYGGSERILGVDLARGLAVLGMYGAHIGVTEAFDWPRPETWLDVVNGRSSILFALLAGVSIAILSGGRRPLDGVPLLQARTRILTRAALIFALGGLLEYLESGIAVILPTYAALFVLSLPFLRWRPAALFGLAGTLALVAPFVTASLALGATGTADDGVEGEIVALLVTGHYPGLIWIVFVLVGLGIGRLDLASRAVALWMLGAGLGLAVVGYGAGELTRIAVSGTALGDALGPFATTEPHSGSPFEVVGSTGFALAVVAMCLLVAGPARWPLYPLAAVGSMALTAYTVHVALVAMTGRGAFYQPDNGLYLTSLVAALIGCSAWRLIVGRGPLEQVLTRVSRMAADAVPRRT
jgi:uncharacterized protein